MLCVYLQVLMFVFFLENAGIMGILAIHIIQQCTQERHKYDLFI